MIKLTTIFFISYALCTTAYSMDDNPMRKVEKKQLTPPSLKQLTPPSLIRRKSSNSSSQLTGKSIKENSLLDAVKEDNLERFSMLLKPDINLPDETGNTPLIIAVMKSNEQIVDLLFKEERLDPNKQNTWQMTALHYAALQNHHPMIEKFIRDPRVDASITNKNNRPKEHKNKNHNPLTEANNTARELLSDQTEEDHALRMRLFARITLDRQVNLQVVEMQLACFNPKTNDMNDDIQSIKQRIDQVHLKQNESNDRKLPQQTELPDYATDEFIKQMLLLRINKLKYPLVITINNSTNSDSNSTQQK